MRYGWGVGIFSSSLLLASAMAPSRVSICPPEGGILVIDPDHQPGCAAIGPGLTYAPSQQLLSSQGSALPFYDARLYGATGDGVTDDTAAINRAITAASTTNRNGGEVVVAAGTYMINAATSVQMLSNVTLHLMPGAVLAAIPNNLDTYNVVQAVSTTNSMIEGGEIRGERAGHIGNTGEWGMCLDLEAVTTFTVRDTEIDACWGDGIYISDNSNNSTPSSNITFDHVWINNARRNGISGINWVGGKIINSIIESIHGTLPESGIDFEPNNSSESVRQIFVANDQIASNNGMGIEIAASNGPVYDNVFTGLDIAFNATSGFYTINMQFSQVSNINLRRNNYAGMDLTGTSIWNQFNNIQAQSNNSGTHGESNIHLESGASFNTFVNIISRCESGPPLPAYGFVFDSGSNSNIIRTITYGPVSFGTGTMHNLGTSNAVD
jgi:hypothetical protein